MIEHRGIRTIRQKRDRRGASPLGDILTGMDLDGAVALKGFFPTDLLRRLRKSVDETISDPKHAVRNVGDKRRTFDVPFAGPFLESGFYAHPLILQVMKGLLGESFCIGNLEVVVSYPGAGVQPVHRDGTPMLDQMRPDSGTSIRQTWVDLPPYAVTLAIPLCGIDGTNGPTHIWPGSHLLDRPREEILVNIQPTPVVGPLGTAFLFDFRCCHSGWPNRSDRIRPLLTLVYHRTWYRDPNQAPAHSGPMLSRSALGRIPAVHQSLFILARDRADRHAVA